MEMTTNSGRVTNLANCHSINVYQFVYRINSGRIAGELWRTCDGVATRANAPTAIAVGAFACTAYL
jgi:hypothetical protein